MRNGILKISICVILSIFLFHQIYASLYNPIKTEKAEYIKYTDGINTTGIIIRSEKVIERSTSGIMHFIIDDGERVSKDGVIADIYTKEEDSVTVNKIADIKKQIENINVIQGYNDLVAVDIELLNSKISGSLKNMLFSASLGDYTESYSYRNELLTMLNRKNMVTGQSYDFSSQLTELNSQLSILENSLNDPISNIRAEESGFFVSETDGFETVLVTDDMSIYTPEFLDGITENPTGDCVGKIVSDYTWYIAAVVDTFDAQTYKKGETVTLHTSLKNNPDISVVVTAVNKSANSNRSTIVFSCKEMNTELASMRTLPLTVVDGVYEGLKVSKSSLRVVDGERGVFVVTGMEISFVKVKVLFSPDNSDYAICEKTLDTDKTVLRLYDKVVTKGKNLYDGKIIN